MFTFITRFFSDNAEIAYLRNEAAHVLIEYQKANLKIANAQKKFAKVRENTINSFENLKCSTFDKTHSAVTRIENKAIDEKADIRSKADEALAKVDVKVAAAKTLASQIDQLGTEKFPLV